MENNFWIEVTAVMGRTIPTKGNTAELVLTVLHRNFLGVDEFLGRLVLPLSQFDHNDKESTGHSVGRWPLSLWSSVLRL